MKKIVLGGGCFWCTEAIFQRVRGVHGVVSGYGGGGTESEPNYWTLHSGEFGHAEVIEVTYDPELISLPVIFDVFFNTHDPTTNNQPGTADKGEEYRSIILCAKEELPIAQKAMQDAQEAWENPIVTEISVLDKFYPAEEQHQDYFNRNKDKNPYCQVVINPKLAKFYERFSELIDEDK